jgi:hypothetical protein
MENYSKETTEKLIQLYLELGNDGLEDIAKTINKEKRSIIAKLSKIGVYVAPSKSKNTITKKHLLRSLEDKGFDTHGLEGATKEALARVLNLIKD